MGFNNRITTHLPSSVKSDTTDVESPPSTPQRKSRRKFDIPLDVLIAHSHMRQDDAARVLKCAPITLKRNCSRHKYRWPYRTIKAQRRREALMLHDCGQKMKKKSKKFSPLQYEKPLTNYSRISGTGSPKAQFPLMNEVKKSELPPLLPPLTLLLQKHRTQSNPVTPPHFSSNVRPIHHHPIDHKSSLYAASFDASAPKFPTGKLAALVNLCELQRRLLPSTHLEKPRYPHEKCDTCN